MHAVLEIEDADCRRYRLNLQPMTSFEDIFKVPESDLFVVLEQVEFAKCGQIATLVQVAAPTSSEQSMAIVD